MKKRVLVMAGYYLPSVKGGGPIQSIKNMVDNLSDRIDFYIVASDRDLGDHKPFEGIEIDKWIKVGKANVFYTNKSLLTWKFIKNIIISTKCDILYLNSFFSYKDSIIPVILRKINKISNVKIILAPRGQFSKGALNLKNRKKSLFINLSKKIGLYSDVIWHATADTEKHDVETIFGKKLNLVVANNLTENYNDMIFKKEIKKNPGYIKIVFISRIHPKKNLKMAIELLVLVEGNVEFNIYGPIEDKLYWQKCQDIIKRLPTNIHVSYKGVVEHEEIMKIYNEHHVFLFPTLGENFGHVISEAFIGGCPVIISDETPWRNLKAMKVGWDINLHEHKEFVNALQELINYSDEEYIKISKKAFEYGKEKSTNMKDIEIYNSLFSY
ncbi:glycosyltransferase family 4 protein [Clostridium algidicarnis]|uniref:glycosyltransferase family 4 protein n=1 Tax=Clostridium algidicarnis TaxID=37659 RepID=UPI001C0D27DF|nr:glycosyltransferase family 4 protein [Clostridium algidicarnis]MBU3205213.1 glycosyltransferase family 4 protein [Clostridium algidicarnis]MBU3213366.1 glycosyltransferase family 4 protein [Clostridium algidicarnis]MBU3223309.1 glycosyltransferase family 4 protein [Clostridium algidicarnis]